ncbi:MAG: DivIVA domain-containing protein [Actinobacteria bacterium]|nr:DivIVA domain-containing protein [Actinomycetota bacterium]
MDVSPQLLREVEFREQWRGYSPDEVDEFLERLAVAVEALQAQLRDAMRRVELAEQRSGEKEDSGDELRRTLVLAQRTADAAVEEARRQAEDMVADAQERAAMIIDDASRHADEVLGALLEHRAMLEEDVEGLNAYVLQYRKRLQRELREGLSWLERSGRLEAGPLPELSDLSVLPVPQPADPRDDIYQEEVAPGNLAGVANEPVAGAAEDVVRFDDTAAYDMSTHMGAGDDTGPHGILTESTTAGSGSREVGVGDEDDGQDPFLAELRRAVTEAEPLGPRDQEPVRDAGKFLDDDLYDEGFSSRFRRRRS